MKNYADRWRGMGGGGEGWAMREYPPIIRARRQRKLKNIHIYLGKKFFPEVNCDLLHKGSKIKTGFYSSFRSNLLVCFIVYSLQTETSVKIDGIYLNEKVEFQVSG